MIFNTLLNTYGNFVTAYNILKYGKRSSFTININYHVVYNINYIKETDIFSRASKRGLELAKARLKGKQERGNSEWYQW